MPPLTAIGAERHCVFRYAVRPSVHASVNNYDAISVLWCFILQWNL